MAKRNFIPLVPSGTINADASVAQLEQDVLAMDAKVGELAEDIGDTEQAINDLKSEINDTVYKYRELPYLNEVQAAWEQGGWSNSTGSSNSTNVLIRMREYLDESVCAFKVDTGYMYRIYVYDGDTYVGYFLADGTISKASSETAYLTDLFDIRAYKKAHSTYKYRISMANTGATNIPVSDYAHLHFGTWDYDIERADKYAPFYPALAIKTINSSTGVEEVNGYRIASDFLSGDEFIRIAGRGVFYVYGYEKDGTYAGVWNGQTFITSDFSDIDFTSIDLKTLPDEYKYRVVLKPYNSLVTLTRAEMKYIQFFRPIVKAEAGVFDKFTIAEWNIGHFSLGVSQSTAITEADYEEKKTAFRQLINEVGADVFMLAEYSEIFAEVSGSNISAKTDLFCNYLHNFIGEQRHYSCNAMYSNIPIWGLCDVDYQCNQNAEITHTSAVLTTDYRYMHGVMTLAGETVHIYGTHCAFDLNNALVETNQYDELIELTKNYAHVIILGDMNAVHDSDEFDAFIAAGFTPINHGYLGDMNTYTGSQSVPNRAIDNIMVRGLAVTKIEKVQTDLSDHDLIKCELSIG